MYELCGGLRLRLVGIGLVVPPISVSRSSLRYVRVWDMFGFKNRNVSGEVLDGFGLLKERYEKV